MTMRVRRVVTGHGQDGRAIVAIDEVMQAREPRPGQEVCAVWASDGVPADNLDPADGALGATSAHLPGGAVFRVVSYAAGSNGNMHRTATVDHGVVIRGAIVLELDDGVEVGLAAGDLLVQRGTIHRWINRGDEACVIAFVLIDALPLD
jgi:quercetin dioxygenase-like cupin family protein